MTEMNLRNTTTAPARFPKPEGSSKEVAAAASSAGGLHVARVELRTADLERALGFYQDVLGFKLIERTGSRAALSPSGVAPVLIVLEQERTAKLRPARATGLYHFAIRYPTRRDLAHALQRLARHHYTIEGASDHLVSEAIYLSDPDGNGVELYADRPSDRWAWRSGQVEMSTKALDLDELLRTIEGKPEIVEPPQQTDIGHIHLHVADLAEAERFYHDALGLAVTQRSYPGALFFAADGYHHHIATNTWAGKAKPPPSSVGLLSYRLEVPSKGMLVTLRERVAAMGYGATADLEAGDDVLRVRDPNGDLLEICAAEPK